MASFILVVTYAQAVPYIWNLIMSLCWWIGAAYCFKDARVTREITGHIRSTGERGAVYIRGAALLIVGILFCIPGAWDLYLNSLLAWIAWVLGINLMVVILPFCAQKIIDRAGRSG